MANEQKEPTIAELKGMLSSDGPVIPQPKETAPPEPEKKEAAVVSTPPASPAENKLEPPKGDKPESASGADEKKEAQESKPEEKPEDKKGKFEPKDEDLPEGVQKRINKAIWEKHNAERLAEQARNEAAELRKQLELKDQAPGKPAPAPEAAKPATQFQFNEPEPQRVKVSQDDYDTIEEYLDAQSDQDTQFHDAHAQWAVKKTQYEAFMRNRQQEQLRQQTEMQSNWQQKIATLLPTDKGLETAIGNVGPLLSAAQLDHLIMQSDVGPEVLKYMDEHGEDTMAVAKTGNRERLASYVGRIEGIILSSKPKATPIPKPETPTPELPEPPRVAGGQTNASKGIDLNDPKISMSDFAREARRQLETGA